MPPSGLGFVCAFRQLVGHPCATCGMTRAWMHAAHGEWMAAFVQSPLGAALFFAAAAIAVFGVPRIAPRHHARVGLAATVLVTSNWIYTWVTGVA